MIHWFDYSFAAISVHFEDLRSDHLLDGFRETRIDVCPARLVHLGWLRWVVLSGTEGAATRYIRHMVLRAHHQHGGSGFRGLFLKYLLRWFDLKHFTFDLPLCLSLLGAVHILNNLSLPHLFLVGLLFAANIILAWMGLTVFLFRLMVEFADLFA
jgi:hypothetical protein